MTFSTAFAGCFLALCLAGGCSSGTASTTSPEGGTLGDGGSDPGVASAVPRVTFDSAYSPGTHPAADCGKAGTALLIGSFGNPALGEPVRPVADGAMDGDGTVAVSCSVTADGDAFQVNAHAQLTGSKGGAVTLSGRMANVGDQTGISVSITQLGETFADSGCTARFDATLGQGIAAGRVWAQVDCPNAANAAAQRICTAAMQLRFENCTQK